MADELTDEAAEPGSETEPGADLQVGEQAEEASETQLTVEPEPEPHSEEVISVESSEAAPTDSGGQTSLDILMEISLLITVELGRREMKFGEILQLRKGSVVELNKLADEPVDIYVNQSKIAEGDVVVIDDHFGVRVTRILNSKNLSKVG